MSTISSAGRIDVISDALDALIEEWDFIISLFMESCNDHIVKHKPNRDDRGHAYIISHDGIEFNWYVERCPDAFGSSIFMCDGSIAFHAGIVDGQLQITHSLNWVAHERQVAFIDLYDADLAGEFWKELCYVMEQIYQKKTTLLGGKLDAVIDTLRKQILKDFRRF